MAPRKLVILLGILVVLGAAAYLSSRPPRAGGGSGPEPGDRIFDDGLDWNAIAVVEVTESDQSLRLEKTDAGWVNTDVFDYPADFERLRTQLLALADLSVGQVVRGGAELVGELGLDTNRVEVVFRDAGGEEMASLQLGAVRTNDRGSPYGGMPDGRYLRTGDEGAIVTVSDSLTGWTSDPGSWIDKSLFEVPGADVRRVRVEHPDGSYEVLFENGGAGRIEELAEGETMNTANIGRLQRALASLRCETVADPAQPEAETGLDAPVVYRAETEDGLRYRAELGSEADQGRYARFAVEFEAPDEPSRENAEALVAEDAEDRDAEIEKELARLRDEHAELVERGQARVEELAFLADWTYVLPGYVADSLRLPRSEVVNPPPEPESEPASINEDQAGTP